MTQKNPHTGQPYRGWKSTKLQLSLITMALVFAGFAFTDFNVEAFEWFVLGLLGASGIYSGGNVVEKIRGMRSGAPPSDYAVNVNYTPASPPPPPATPPEAP